MAQVLTTIFKCAVIVYFLVYSQNGLTDDLALTKSGYRLDHANLCDGFPRLNITTTPGMCMGLVIGAQDSDATGAYNLLFPRNIISLPGLDEFLITDLGRWQKDRGRLWHLYKDEGNKYQLRLLLDKLDRPHGLAIGPNDNVYIGESSRVLRLRISALNEPPEIVTAHRTSASLENPLHPLTSLAFGPENTLIVGMGSESDLCRNKLAQEGCSDPAARIKSYALDKNGSLQVIDNHHAVGLRNPMGLAFTPVGGLFIAESAHDSTDQDAPYDELNFIAEPGNDFGWPVCEDMGSVTNEWQAHRGNTACEPHASNYTPPIAVLPPHSTPLGLIFWPEERSLLITLHGYRSAGHRLISVLLNEDYLPVPNQQAFYLRDTAGGTEQVAFAPHRSQSGRAKIRYLISDWNRIENVRPQGSPVGLTRADDGSIWMVEDRNKSILRLAREQKD